MAQRRLLLPAAALLLLSLLEGADGLRSNLLPGLLSHPLSALQREAMSLALFAVSATGVAWLLKAKLPAGRQLWIAAEIGIGLFAIPALLMHFSYSSTSGFTRSALMTLVPLLAVVLEPYFRNDAAQQPRSGLVAALVSLAGALFVFPVTILGTVNAGIGFAAVVLAAISISVANCGAVRALALLPENSSVAMLPTAAIAAGAAALLLAIVELSVERAPWTGEALAPQLLWSALIDLPALFLLFWLLRRLTAVQTAVRFILAPLLVILTGAFAMQQPMQLETWLGLLLMVAGACWLLVGGMEAGHELLSIGSPPDGEP